MSGTNMEMTRYFRSIVAANAHPGIDFKTEFVIMNPEELISGQVHSANVEKIFQAVRRTSTDDDNRFSTGILNVIISAKTAKTNFEAFEKVQDEVDALTGIFFIPATLSKQGELKYDTTDKKLPWFPREYLDPMVDPLLSVGSAEEVDRFISHHVDQLENVKTWADYVTFFKGFYSSVTGVSFDDGEIPSRVDGETPIELEQHVYLFVDHTVHSTYHIMSLYNHLLRNNQIKPLYTRFMSREPVPLKPLQADCLASRKLHAGQMGGEYPLSPSQREAVAHFNTLSEGEFLAVNGPPGTGKTTLLQSIVADLVVHRAIKQEKPPIIVATSTNNQAVTNIITSFGNIQKVGLSILEERWIEGVSSFAVYFPSGQKIAEARSYGFQYTNSRGEHFAAAMETKENIKASRIKFVRHCNDYFGTAFTDLNDCRDKLHNELVQLEQNKQILLELCDEAEQFECQGSAVDAFLVQVEQEIEATQSAIRHVVEREKEWRDFYRGIPFYRRWLPRLMQPDIRLFMSMEELDFLKDTMKYREIKEAYSFRYAESNRKLAELTRKLAKIKDWIARYDRLLQSLESRGILLHEKGACRYDAGSSETNERIDTKIRYRAFWLAVHYYECRWVSGEDALSDKQVGTSYRNVLEKFYNRLAMLTPCMVMTFYMLPKQFLAYGDHNHFYMYNHINLLIVDEAGQVSPEIAAGAFALAQKAIVVGDCHQIEPVWGISKALDKALALANGAINEMSEYEQLEQIGLSGCGSSAMRAAAMSCSYGKFGDRGLFLSEHRRCYDEIIDYCNRLVYKGNLEPKRGKGKEDKNRAIPNWPIMGYRQVDTHKSRRIGTSRYNRGEAIHIAEWVSEHFVSIREAYPREAEANLIGIITPFKAQAGIIKAEIKKKAPDLRNKVTVGTVHAFQGAERKLILFSTVYAGGEGCFFIDTNKSLMNVAVSRAKDHFFVVGDLHCLKDTPSSPSGLLKSFVRDHPL